jgi:hypothetical protein
VEILNAVAPLLRPWLDELLSTEDVSEPLLVSLLELVGMIGDQRFIDSIETNRQRLVAACSPERLSLIEHVLRTATTDARPMFGH